MKKRVVITGVGAVSPIGIGKDEFWTNLVNGKSGVGKITRFDPTEYSTQIAGEVKDFDPTQFIDKKEAKRMDRTTQFAVAAAKMAIADAKLDVEKENRERIGVFIGSGIGGMETLHSQYETLFQKGPNRISPFFIPMMIGNMPAGQVSITFNLQGPTSCVVTACATGTNSVGDAFKVIQRGDADVMLAGGTEACISPAPVAGFCAMKALSTNNENPEKASRPFDKGRDGFVMGEGAGVVILESLDHAIARGATIYAEVAGYGSNSDAYHITAPAPEGVMAAKCMGLAVKDAGLDVTEIDYINAHGTSTPLNDKNETLAIKSLFGDHAKNLAISSIKSMTGHLLGAAGGVEAIASLLALQHQFIPPTINVTEKDPEIDLNLVINDSIETKLTYAMSNSLGFGGHNAVILMKRWEA